MKRTLHSHYKHTHVACPCATLRPSSKLVKKDSTITNAIYSRRDVTFKFVRCFSKEIVAVVVVVAGGAAKTYIEVYSGNKHCEIPADSSSQLHSRRKR